MSVNEEESIRIFFTDEQWNKISPYEKLRCVNLKRNYEALKQLGLTAQMPDFMLPVSKLRRRPNLEEELEIVDVEAVSDNDDEWLPEKEKQKKSKTKGSSKKSSQVKNKKTFAPPTVQASSSKPAQQIKLQAVQTKSSAQKNESNDSRKSEDGIRYPLRQLKTVSYKEMELTDDSFLFCDECNAEHPGDCPIHGPLTIVKDTEVPLGEDSRATKTLPLGLSIGPSRIKDAGKGVWTDLFIPKGVRFGPYEGVIVDDEKEAQKSGYCWEIFRGKQPPVFVDARNEAASNWMRYVNCARNEEEQNLIAFQYRGSIYYRTFKPVVGDVELLVWYGEKYAEELGLRNMDPVKAVSLVGKAGSAQKDGLLDVTSLSLFPCRSCRCVMLSASSLARHEKRKHSTKQDEDKRFQCNYCSYGTNHTTNLQKHIRVHTGERPFACAYCDKKFVQKSNMICHEKNSHRKEKSYACEICEKRFRRRDNRNKHVKTIHLNQNSFKCLICDTRTATYNQLQIHLQIHTGEKPYSCDVCGKQFSRSSDLKSHLRIHSGEKPYSCDVCSKQFRDRTSLKNHLRIHSGEKPYSCDVCSKQFRDRTSLKNHLRIHSGEKPYSCDVCSKQFRDRTSLKNHLRIHSGEKPYSCDVCSKQFSERTSLKNHLRIHSGEKPYSCDVCSKQFNQSSNLKSHLRIHRSKTRPQCDTSQVQFPQIGSLQQKTCCVTNSCIIKNPGEKELSDQTTDATRQKMMADQEQPATRDPLNAVNYLLISEE